MVKTLKEAELFFLNNAKGNCNVEKGNLIKGCSCYQEAVDFLLYEELYSILDNQCGLAGEMQRNVGIFNKLLRECIGYEKAEIILSDTDFLDSVTGYAENGESVSKEKMIKHLEQALKKEV